MVDSADSEGQDTQIDTSLRYSKSHKIKKHSCHVKQNRNMFVRQNSPEDEKILFQNLYQNQIV